MIDKTNQWRKKPLSAPIESGTVVLEAVISEYDLSKSWDSTSNSSANKGYRFVLATGNDGGSPDDWNGTQERQGASIALLTSESGVEVRGTTFYSTDQVVVSEGDSVSDLANSSQADNRAYATDSM